MKQFGAGSKRKVYRGRTQANQPVAPYCRSLAVRGELEKSRLGGKRRLGALAVSISRRFRKEAVPKEKRFTELIKCGHCQNQAHMEIVSSHSTVRDYSDDRSGMSWEAGAVYELNQCPACEGITLRRYLWHSGAMDPSEVEYTQLYPMDDRDPRGLPKAIESGYHAAQKVRNIDANAYGVLLGRVLDLVCEDRQASGDTLDQRLRHLAENGEIPAKLVDVATGLRKLRNIGAHADLSEYTKLF